jgi:hypothetical protein
VPWTRSIVVWLALMLAESVHGALRTRFLTPAMGDFPARRLGVLTGVVLIFLISFALFEWLGARTRAALLGVGALWVALTVVFEIALGRLVLGYDWTRIVSDYDLARGGLMGLGLIALLLMPLAVARVRATGGSRRTRADGGEGPAP